MVFLTLGVEVEVKVKVSGCVLTSKPVEAHQPILPRLLHYPGQKSVPSFIEMHPLLWFP